MAHQGEVGGPSLIDSAFTKSSSGPGPGLVLGTMTRMGHPSQPLSQVLGGAKHWSKGSGHKRWPKAGWSLLGGEVEDSHVVGMPGSLLGLE